MGGKKQREEMEKTQLVLYLLAKISPLNPKQKKMCEGVCVERFLKARGGNPKKAARQLRAWLSWRDSIGADSLIADEFTAELSEGMAYISGFSQEQSNPVVIFRIKQEYQKLHSPKMLTRLFAFTLEVAMGTMTNHGQCFALLFDASLFRSASAFLTMLISALKMVADYYPGLLSHAFVIDPPSLFPHLWKGVKAFVELSSLTTIIWSSDIKKSTLVNEFDRPCSNPTKPVGPRTGSSTSSRFSFTVSSHGHMDSLKPWYLSFTDSSKVGPTTAQISPVDGRSVSFGYQTGRGPEMGLLHEQVGPTNDSSAAKSPRTPWPSFLPSPGILRRKEGSGGGKKGSVLFVPFVKLYRRPYDEEEYRSKMKPPLGGLMSVMPRHLRRRHVSTSQRFFSPVDPK